MSDGGPENIIYFFIDGIGFGLNDRSRNPFARFGSQFFPQLGGIDRQLPPGKLLEVDATMGVEGVPQSATGQTALFTGYNASQIVGRHISGFPTVKLRPYLKQYSLLKRFIRAGERASVVNTYTSGYLKKLSGPRSERLMSATTMMQKWSGQPFLTLDDLKNNESIFMDITNWMLKESQPGIEEKNPKERGRTLVRIARNYGLVLFEYFLPDRVGHDGDWGEARMVMEHLDEFMAGIWEELDRERQCVIVCSDHGNFEDLLEPGHTMNLTPLWVYGKGEDSFDSSVKTLYDIPRKIFSICRLPFSPKLPRFSEESENL